MSIRTLGENVLQEMELLNEERHRRKGLSKKRNMTYVIFFNQKVLNHG